MDQSAVSAGFVLQAESQRISLPDPIISSISRVMERLKLKGEQGLLKGEKPNEEQIRLPFDVMEVIARCLAEESLVDDNDGTSRTTLARLNRVSKAVHEVTLPALYETTDYFHEEDFSDSVQLANPKGWKWTKYLSLGHVSEPLLCQQQRHSRGLHTISDSDLDFAAAFPRIRLACHLGRARDVAAFTLGYRINVIDLEVTLLKPISFEELQYRCRPCSNGSWDIFGLFGINPRFPTSPPEMSRHRRAGNITELIVAKGAGIVPPSNCRFQRRPWNVANRGTVEEPSGAFGLALWDPTPTPLTASTIDLVLESLEFGRAATIDRWGREPILILTCYPSVFASFGSSLDPSKLLPDLSITLLGTVDSEDDIVQLITTLAESISPYYLCLGSREFVTLTCGMPVPPGIVPCSYGRRDCEFHIKAALQEGQPENEAGPRDRSGFTLTVESFLRFTDGRMEKTDFRYQRAYPGVQLLQ